MHDYSKGRCQGYGRYTVQCKNRTKTAYSLCHLHVRQVATVNAIAQFKGRH